LFPAIALLAAVAWLAWLEREDQNPSRWFARMRVVQAGIGALILPAALVFAPAKFPVPHAAWMWVVAVTIAGGWWTAARLAARRLDRAAALGAGLTAATLAVSLAILVPPVATVTTARDLAQAINRSGQFPPELWLVEQRRGSLVFYLDPALRRGLTADRVLQLSSPQVPEHEPVPGTLVAVTVADSARLAQYVPLEGQPFELAGHYRIYDGERLLHTRPIPSHLPHHRVVDRASPADAASRR
jgi:hypothetical protein